MYSDNDETTASKLRSANRRLNEAEQTIKDLRNRVRFLEGRVVTLGRWQDRAASGGGGGGGGSGGSGGGGDGAAAAIATAPGAGRKLRPLKKRKARGGEAVDVSVGDGGAGGAAVEEGLGRVESMLAEVCCNRVLLLLCGVSRY